MSKLDTQDLAAYAVPAGAHVLSVYLQTHSAESLTVFRNRLKRIETRFDDESEQRDLTNCVDRVTNFLSHFEARAPMLVLFCTATGSMWVRQIDVLLPNEVRWDQAPYWKPLIEVIDECEPYAVLLLDNSKARLFATWVGKIHEHRPLLKDLSESDDSFLKNVIAAVEEIIRKESPSRLIVAGDREIFPALLSLLPSWQKSVIAMVQLPIDTSPEHVLEITGKLEQLAERRCEIQQVTDLVRLAVGHKKVVLGLNFTLDALNAGRIWRLVYSEGFSPSGGQCGVCDSLSSNDVELCSRCTVAVRPADDLVAAMVDRALKQDASIEQVRGEAAHRLNEVGSIGAFLRW